MTPDRPLSPWSPMSTPPVETGFYQLWLDSDVENPVSSFAK